MKSTTELPKGNKTSVNSKDADISNVINSRSFKDEMEQDIIPKVLLMAEKEKEHLSWLMDKNAPKDMIYRSNESLCHLLQRHSDYIEYVKGLK